MTFTENAKKKFHRSYKENWASIVCYIALIEVFYNNLKLTTQTPSKQHDP